MAPIVEELAQEYEGKAVIGKYNIEEENDLAMKYRIMSIPTILFFKNGEQVRDLRMTAPQRTSSAHASRNSSIFKEILEKFSHKSRMPRHAALFICLYLFLYVYIYLC